MDTDPSRSLNYTRDRTHIDDFARLPMQNRTTRVFNNGNSPAVRIPAEFRLDTDRVQISRAESGDLSVLVPTGPSICSHYAQQRGGRFSAATGD